MIRSQDGGPYAVKTILGWTIVGPRIPVFNKSNNSKIVRRTNAKNDKIERMFIDMYNNDFIEKDDGDSLSREDKLWEEKVKESIVLRNGHYEIGLPFKNTSIDLPNNRKLAEKRAEGLKRKMNANAELHTRYTAYMRQLLEDGHAEVVPVEDRNISTGQQCNVWYLPHHAVTHPAKPDKTRVVFDCSAKYAGVSLNDKLLQGPDLINSLGVLVRFRQEPVAFMADIKAMYHQVRVPQEQRNYLRFLWWPDGNTEKQLEEYRMKVHLFGAISSPSCANFALWKTADDFSAIFGGQKTQRTIDSNFYVDDCLKSVADVDEAIESIRDVRNTCNRGGFHLTKFVSNERAVMESVAEEDRATDHETLQVTQSTHTEERALGILWNTETDTLSFKIKTKERPTTRRGMLSTVSSIYDPLGFVAPILLKPKALLQRLCRLNLAWDDLPS